MSVWLFELFDKVGLIKKYEELFDAIGNPEKLDIFRREGEAVASISYGVRAFEGVAPGFKALIGSKEIVRIVRDMRGRPDERHTDALRIVNNLESNGTEWRTAIKATEQSALCSPILSTSNCEIRRRPRLP
jgi:hypothetical protein